ncbi:class I SAM-dependent methyltransferase [Aquimarina pacifica]|uniref:class I SAM-dependent methyltransferase n=1 Tax=Aquimarina pacifica TaxID=1296415 RepID=UPI000470A5F2|nr:class I SAM-dependent methyltransferase [Aquimarina pacifica]
MEEKYDRIGTNYNRTRKSDPYLFGRLYALLNPSINNTYLDIGCGTGNYTSQFANKGYQFIGIDPSEEMLKKARRQNQKSTYILGKAEHLELATASIDGIIASLTLHHWQDLNQGFSELNRVLKPEGTMVIFTATPNQMKGYWLHHYFPKTLIDSIAQMPSYEHIDANLQANGLIIVKKEKYNIRPDLQDLFLYSGKHNPNLYLDPNIREGISSFSSLANAEEVRTGLEALNNDIKSGEIHKIMTNYINDKGDYIFIVVKKNETPVS